MKSFKLIWHYMAFDRDLVSERSKKNLNQIRQETIAVIDEIEKTQEFLPRENPVCPWCEFKEICPLMKHAQKIEQLPVNEYLNEPGIRLVNQYAELSEKKNQMLEEIENELEKIKEALIQYAEKEGVETIQGVNHKMKVKAKQILKFPTKDDTRRMDLEKTIKKSGQWEHFSELSLSSLGEAFQNKELAGDLLEKIQKFTELEKTYRFYLSKLKTD
jgi:putative RecB family exonuclease